jgi:anaerobic magnesium-protoporphyrin IX monomethyl ester cyclase
MRLPWLKRAQRRSDILWLDLGDLGDLVSPRGPHEQWQDHGLGLLRTIMHRAGIETDLLSTRAVSSWDALAPRLSGYRILLMNVRSYTFPMARKAAELFKAANPDGWVLTGGMHASVAPAEMQAVAQFDRICSGPGEGIILDLVRAPEAFPRMFPGRGSRSMAEWPVIDRELWPKPVGFRLRRRFPWPLEPACGWGPPPVATVLTSRVCPWQCAFCNEASYIPAMGRRPVDAVIDELNRLDERHGVGSVVIHDSMFLQNPHWLEEWLEKYPRRARRVWPYWAAARSDTVRRWPQLFEALLRETHWNVVSIGFESGSQRMLRMLNKECSEEDNRFAIDLLNSVGDAMAAEGREPPRFWANIMLGIPGETREDAFMTMRMLKRMKRALPSIAFYAPYPGSVLGHQLIAEGRSLMSADNYHRYPDDEKVRGVDYDFYRELLAGRYEAEVNLGLSEDERRRGPGGHADALVKA